jgi:hypothetical protein
MKRAPIDVKSGSTSVMASIATLTAATGRKTMLCPGKKTL